MKKLFIITLLNLLTLSFAWGQWVSNYWMPSHGDLDFSHAKGLAVTVDDSGYCYVTGYAFNDLSGNNDIITIKYDLDGDTLWTAAYNGTASSDSGDVGNGIAVDDNGNVYVVGQASVTGRGLDIVLVKYSSTGVYQWDKPIRGSDNATPDVGLAIAIDQSGFIYVTGFTTAIDGYKDAVLIKCSPEGNEIARSNANYYGSFDSEGLAIAIDSEGNICVAGYTTDTSNNVNILLTKFNSSDSVLWIQSYNGTGNGEDKAFGIVADGSNNIYITGYSSVSHDSSANYDCITIKYDASGVLQWADTYNGSANEEDKAFGIVADNNDNIYVTGYASRSNNDTLSFDYVTLKYSSGGVRQWESLYNGTGNGDDKACAVAILNNSNVVITGSSIGQNQNFDYATVKYNKTNGNVVAVSRYFMTGNSEDIAKSIDVSDAGSLYITGFSELIVEATVAPSAISTMAMNWGVQDENSITSTNARKFALHQNYPNPFNPATTINYEIGKASIVKIVVYDMLGREITTLVNEYKKEGNYHVVFSPKNLASGIYFYNLTTDGYRDTKKMMLIK